MTVDNPTWQPIWLEIPAGTIVNADGQDWVVGLVAPFRMMRKQKTGRTIDAFPLLPASPGAVRPRKLAWSSKAHEQAVAIRELALAAQRLAAASRRRDPSWRPGALESAEPFDFWPIVLRWSVWKLTTAPPREMLLGMVRDLLHQRASFGDTAAATLDPNVAATEVEAAVARMEGMRPAIQGDGLPVDLQCARDCLR